MFWLRNKNNNFQLNTLIWRPACGVQHSSNRTKKRSKSAPTSVCVEPGDKVLVLLPIPGRPLQARYYGPYTVDKKLSDVNYTVNTPGRRKQKQLCHINMLKKYIDRDSSVISLAKSS